MKRMHVHIAVEDIARSVEFYSTLFATEPSVIKPDYAKWMLEDPRVNIAISARGPMRGVDHLGIQTENKEELEEVYTRLSAANAPLRKDGEGVCCYARSDKGWVSDPVGVPWEVFHTLGESVTYAGGAESGEDESSEPESSARCVPKPEATGACC